MSVAAPARDASGWGNGSMSRGVGPSTPTLTQPNLWGRFRRAKAPTKVMDEAREAGVGTFGALVRHYLFSVEFQLFVAVLILVDVALLLDEKFGSGHSRFSGAFILHWVIVALYTVEAFALLVFMGFRNFLRVPWHLVHIAAVLQLWAYALRYFKHCHWSWPIVTRFVPMMELIIALPYPLLKALRMKVSKKRHRYRDYIGNFDLDLTFIASDLIAMGVPATGVQAIFRNPLSEVARFFRSKYAHHFRIYSACPELPYSDSLFKEAGGDVVRFQIQDHTPPTMDQFLAFLINARSWTAEDPNPKHVLAVHCKAGKGRTGCLCCAWLMYSQRSQSAEAALLRFAEGRTDTRLDRSLHGVETPSQVRYVKQLWQHLQRTNSWLTSPHLPPPCPAPAIRLHSLDFVGQLVARPEEFGNIKVLVQRRCGEQPLELIVETAPVSATAPSVDLGAADVSGDVRVSVFKVGEKSVNAHEAVMSAKHACKAPGIMFFVLFHTGFMSEETLEQKVDVTQGCTASDVTRDTEQTATATPEAAPSLQSFWVPIESIDKANRRAVSRSRGPGLIIKYSTLNGSGPLKALTPNASMTQTAAV